MPVTGFTRRYGTWRWPGLSAIPVLLAGLFFLSGCQVYRYIPPDQRLIEKNQVKVTTQPEDAEVRDLAVQLENLIDRSPNTRVLGLFRTYLWLHFRNERSGKQTRYRRFVRDNLAEPPVYVDSLTLGNNLEAMLIFLRNRGFFQAEGEFTLRDHPDKPLSRVTYQVRTGRPLRIRQFDIRSSDPSLARWLPELNRQSTLKPGMIVNGDAYTREVTRITDFLRNRGYAFFFPNQISALQVDVADTSSYLVPVFLEILPPAGGQTSRPVTIGEITLHTSVSPGQPAALDTFYRHIRLRDAREESFLQPDVLYRALDLQPDSLYQEGRFTRSNRRLSMLGVYRFVNIRTREDTLAGMVNLDVQLTPVKRYALEQSLEVNNTTAIGDNSNVLGLSLSSSIASRNLFRRAIRMELSLEPSVETNLNPIQANALNANTKLRFQFPFFEDYFRVWQKSRLGKWYPYLRDDARSHVAASYTYNNLLNFWETHFMNINYGFEYNPRPNLRVTLDHFQVDYYKNDLKAGFLDNAPPGSELAFQNQFLTGFLFRSIKGYYNALPNKFGETWSFKGGFEQSGLEILAINGMQQLFQRGSDYWKAGEIGFAKYLRGDGQWTYARTFGKGQSAATRFYGGLIVPLADTRTSPYIKQFSAGGPSSMRGWLNGQLGPGSYRQVRDRPPFFQRGDLRLEINAEWRQRIFWILEGAVFLDAGNIWNLREDPEQPGAGLRDMHKEWALAGGIGIRLNFQFFVIVYDVGAKLRYPYPVNGSHWAQRPDLNFQNLLINYPF